MNRDRIKIVLIALCIPIVEFIVFTLCSEGFGMNSVLIILSQCTIPFVMGMGVYLTTLPGLFDLSVGAQIVTSGLISAWLSQIYGLPGLIVGSIVIAVLIGALVGGCYTVLKVPSMVVSLGLVMILEYLGKLISVKYGASYIIISAEVAAIGTMPWNFIVAGIAAFIFYLINYKLPLGTYLRAVGSGEIITGSVGVSAAKVKALAFVCSGLFMGFGAILNTTYAGSMGIKQNLGSLSLIYEPVMAVMIAIEIDRQIRFAPISLLISVLSISILYNGMISLGLPGTMQDIVLGGFMIIILVVTGNVSRMAEKARRRRVRLQAAEI